MNNSTFDTDAFSLGEAVTWIHQPHGGYGYLIDVPARVVKITPQRIRIAALLKDGSQKVVTVRPSNLKKQEAKSHD